MRRSAGRILGALALVLGATRGLSAQDAVAARLTARPGAPTEPGATGDQPLDLDASRDGRWFVPASYRTDRPMPLLLLLHGAGGSGARIAERMRAWADSFGVILLAPDSRAMTWDGVRRAFGPDVAFIDAALRATYRRYAIDPRRIAIGGFSDGASYALSLGLTNGDVFGAVVAFSPCILRPDGPRGRPRVFVSHGTGDDILPIERCSRRLVPALRERGYTVTYREFDGGHAVPPDVGRAGFAWLVGGR